jgi:small subunit ribosomal protein S10
MTATKSATAAAPKAHKPRAAATHKAADKEPAVKTAATKKEEAANRIRLKIRAYDNRIIDQAAKTIVDTAGRYDAKVVGPVPLPTEKVKFTVNRSTFIDKNAREQYEMRTHKRLVDIVNASPQCIDALMSLNLPSGVDVEIKM